MFEFEIINFQSIEYAKLPIRDFTAIIGPSNRGKSSVIRALRAILYNEHHLSFIRHGAKECILRLHFVGNESYNLKTVEFIKSSSKNSYTITFKDGSTKTYLKVGTSVPEELQGLGFTPLTTERGDSFNLNFQGQLEPLFLVAESPSALTSFMNKIFQIEQYERVLRNMSADFTQLIRSYDKLGAEITEKQRQHTELVEVINNTTQQRDTLQAALISILQSEDQLDIINKAIATWKATIDFEQSLIEMRHRYKTLNKVFSTLETLMQVARTYQKSVQFSFILSTAQASYSKYRNIHSFYSRSNQYFAHLIKYLSLYKRSMDLLRILQHFMNVQTNSQSKLICYQKGFEYITILNDTLKRYYKLGLMNSQLVKKSEVYETHIFRYDLMKKASHKLSDLSEALNQYLQVYSAQSNLDTYSRQLSVLNTSRAQYELAGVEADSLEKHWYGIIGYCPLCGSKYDELAHNEATHKVSTL